MDEEETAAKVAGSLIVLYADRPAYLKQVYHDWERLSASAAEWPSLTAWGTPDVETPEEAWHRLIGELSPIEWLQLGGPHTLDRIISYLDPSEFDHIKGPYTVSDEIERRRLAILLWRHLVVYRNDVTGGAKPQKRHT
jgi:hypothetical protein